MTNQSKCCLISLMLLIYGIQVTHTVFNEVNWPFCSHNFYYHRSPLVKDLFRISLLDNQNNKVTVDPRHVLPIEGYRSGAVFREVYVKSDDVDRQQAFAKLLLERLNNGGWKGFDERFSPASPNNGNQFVALTVEKHWIDTTQYGITHQLRLAKKEVIFDYSKDKDDVNR